MPRSYAPSYALTNKALHFLIATSLASAALATSAADAAVLTLKNGDRITGELLQADDGLLVFKSESLGEIRIARDKVQSLIAEEGTPIPLQAEADASEEADTVTAETAAAQSDAVASEVQGESTASSSSTAVAAMKYSGQFDVGGTLNRGNSTDEQLNVLGEFVARSAKNRYTLGLVVNEGQSGGITTTSNRRLHGQYDAFVNAKDFLFVRARVEQDEMADLDLRTGLGGGYGRQFIDSEVMKLSGQVGVNYVKERYENASDQSFPTLSIGMKFDREFLQRKLVYFHYLDVDTSLRDSEDTLLRNRLGLRVPLAQGLNVSTQLNHDYANRPAAGKKKLDTALIFSVGYGF